MARFEKGQSGNAKGCPKGKHGRGRPSNEFRELCAKAWDEVDALGLMKAIIAGVKFDTSFGKMPAKPETRLEAIKTLKEWIHGKETQRISGEDGEPLSIQIVSYAEPNDSL